MNIFLDERAQDEICEELIKKFAGIYYSYKPVDIVGFAKYLGLDLRYVTFCDDLDRLGFYSDGETPVVLMTKRGPIRKVFPNNTVLISDSLRPAEKKNKLRFTVAHEVTHHIRCLISGKPAEAAYMTDIESNDDISVEALKSIMNHEENMANLHCVPRQAEGCARGQHNCGGCGGIYYQGVKQNV